MSFLSQVGDVAREAGELIRELSTNRALRIEEKGSSYDFVTEADTGSQRLIARRVGEMFPGDIVIGEEDNLPDAQIMARDICQRIEKEMTYPGQIKITVIRETRSVDYAK